MHHYKWYRKSAFGEGRLKTTAHRQFREVSLSQLRLVFNILFFVSPIQSGRHVHPMRYAVYLMPMIAEQRYLHHMQQMAAA
jgi:hypothetical protein